MRKLIHFRVWHLVGDHSWNHSWGLVEREIKYQVWEQIRIQVWDQVMVRVRDLIRDQIQEDNNA